MVASLFQLYGLQLGKHRVTIASSPSNAEIRINADTIGRTPVTIKLKRGSYILEASKEGFETGEVAIYVSRRSANVVNVQLSPKIQTSTPPYAEPPRKPSPTPGLAEVAAEVAKIRSMILANPEEATTVPILQDKVRLQAEEIKAIRDEAREQFRWYIGIVIAVIVGLLGVIATLFIAQKGK